jgi:hypothetical protein
MFSADVNGPKCFGEKRKRPPQRVILFFIENALRIGRVATALAGTEAAGGPRQANSFSRTDPQGSPKTGSQNRAAGQRISDPVLDLVAPDKGIRGMKDQAALSVASSFSVSVSVTVLFLVIKPTGSFPDPQSWAIFEFFVCNTSQSPR